MRLKEYIRRIVQNWCGIPAISSHALDGIEPSRKNTKVLLGRLLARLNEKLPNDAPIGTVEFQVFSQFGDDGIIQFLISRLPIKSRTFVEFGVEDYRESNTRFLLMNNRWAGLVIDGNPENVQYIKGDGVSWYHLLNCTQAFVTRDNINKLIADSGFPEEIGILSIDLDGVDYWIWEAVTIVRPTIVIIEYNSALGAESFLTVPYQSDFRWMSGTSKSAHYWGASLGALVDLGKRKGYDLFGCNSAGNNAYFIRSDRRGSIPTTTVADAYVEGQFVLSWDANGGPVRGCAGMRFLKGLKFFDVRTKKDVTF